MTVEEDGYHMNRFTLGEHTGAHVDVPSHFAAGQPHVSGIPPEQLVGLAAVIGIDTRCARDPPPPGPLGTGDGGRVRSTSKGQMQAVHSPANSPSS